MCSVLRKSHGFRLVLLFGLAVWLLGGQTGRAEQRHSVFFPLIFSQASKDSSVLRERYGVVFSGPDVAETMNRLGLNWYLDYGYNVDTTPANTRRALFIGLEVPMLREDTLRGLVSKSPGSYWIIGGEPNVKEQGNKTGKEYAEILNYYTIIKRLDPSARLVGPGVLNFDYTCNGCDGYQTGRSWLEEFRASYRDKYGTEPPLDVWSLDSYDFNWFNLPTVNHQVIIDQLLGLRGYLDSIPEHRGKPIWLAEFGVIWGYDTLELKDGKAYSSGSLREERMKDFMLRLLTWLDEHADEYRIDKWFIYASHPLVEPWASIPGGIHLIDGRGTASKLSPFGKIYHDMAQGLSLSR